MSDSGETGSNNPNDANSGGPGNLGNNNTNTNLVGGSNDGGNVPSQPNVDGEGTAATDGTQLTRNITVSIQYSYFTPANFAANMTAPGTTEATDLNGIPTNIAANAAGTVATATTLGTGHPDGAVVLSFRDVPASTPQERLESIISIAAELAMRRFSDIAMASKGIPKDEFEKLPVLEISKLPADSDKICSICYDDFEDEPENSKKRQIEDEISNDDTQSSKKKKKTNDSQSIPQSEDAASASNRSILSQSTPSEPIVVDSIATENEHPSYLHSPIQVPCEHIFGRECLYKWTRLENTCPLCRNVIVEVIPQQGAAPENTNETNADAFERIRQLIYSTNPNDTVNPTGPDRPTNDTVGSYQTTGANTATSGAARDAFSMSRSGIVFLRPDTPGAPSIGGQLVVPLSGISPTIQTTGINGIAPPTNPPLRTPTDNRINWVPIPITLIQLNHDTIPPTTSNSTSSTETVIQGPTNSTARGLTQSDRLRTILDHIFNTTQGDMAASPTSDPPAPTPAPAPTTPTSSEGDAAPSRRSNFIENILRIANRSRNPPNGSPSSTTAGDPARNGPLFNSGVSSYRNRNGQVSTYNIDNEDILQPPHHAQNQDGNQSNNEENEQNIANQNNNEAS